LPKKILFLTRSLDHGGAERQLVELAKGLHQKGYSILVLTFYPAGAFEKDLLETGVPVKSLQKRGRWDVVFFIVRLVRLLINEKPDVIHGYLAVPNILITILKPLFPNSRIVWGVRASNMDLSEYDWLSRLLFRVQCFCARFANLIIVNSNAGRDYHKKRDFPEDKIIVIPNGIDTDRFKPDFQLRERVRAEWGIKKEDKLIGLVARLDPMKDHRTFLKAAAMLASERHDVHFVCIGDGAEPYKLELQRLSRDLELENRLTWAGNRGDMIAVYNALDIATSSSFGEGFPNVIGEAMACGVPCVVTDVGDSALIVGDLGIVVRHSSPEDLKNGWIRCLTANLVSQSEAIRKRIVNHFCTENLIEQTLAVLLPQ
jgi:glycosyltransferase involved in cell wall biosynthesis